MIPNYESRFQLPSGKWVHVPTCSAREHGVALIRWIDDRWRAPDYFYHLRAGGHVAAARSHLRNRFFAKLDLRNFFYTVTRTKVHRALKALGADQRQAFERSQISTVEVPPYSRNFAIPYGFVQSPMLASIALAKSAVGLTLGRISSRRITTSVYVDDIVLSCKDESELRDAYLMLTDAAQLGNFEINEEKSRGPSECVTAFNLEIRHSDLRVTQPRMLEFSERIAAEENPAAISGIVTYVATVNTAQSAILTGS